MEKNSLRGTFPRGFETEWDAILSYAGFWPVMQEMPLHGEYPETGKARTKIGQKLIIHFKDAIWKRRE